METLTTVLTGLGVVVALATYLHADIRHLETRMDKRMDSRFAQVDARFAQVDARFARIEGRMDKLDSRMDKLDDRVYALATGFKAFTDERHLSPE